MRKKPIKIICSSHLLVVNILLYAHLVNFSAFEAKLGLSISFLIILFLKAQNSDCSLSSSTAVFL